MPGMMVPIMPGMVPQQPGMGNQAQHKSSRKGQGRGQQDQGVLVPMMAPQGMMAPMVPMMPPGYNPNALAMMQMGMMGGYPMMGGGADGGQGSGPGKRTAVKSSSFKKQGQVSTEMPAFS